MSLPNVSIGSPERAVWIPAFPLNNSGTHKTRRRAGMTVILFEIGFGKT